MNLDRLDPTFRELVERHVAGEATPEQSRRLERRLLESAAARDFYLDYLNLHSALRRRFFLPDDESESTEEATAARAELRAALALESPAADDATAADGSRPREVRKRSSSRVATIAAAGLALAASIAALAFFATRDAESTRLARDSAALVAVEGEATLESAVGPRVASVGDALRPGESLRVAGEEARVELEYSDGTRVRLHEGAVVRAPDDGAIRLRLLAGSVEVAAAKQRPDRPLVFATEHSRYVVLGTRFRLYHDAESSRLELDEGKVRLERPASGETVEVEAGSVAIAAADAAPVEVRPLSLGSAELKTSIHKAGHAAAFTPDEATFVTSHASRGLLTYRAEDAAPEHGYAGDSGHSDALAVTPDGRTVVQVNRNGYVLAWRPGETSAIKMPLWGRAPRSRAISPDGLAVAESSEDGNVVYEVDLADGLLRPRYDFVGPGKAWCLALSRNAARLAVGYWDGTLQVHDLATGEIVHESRLQHTPTQLAISEDGARLAVFTQRDGLLTIDLATGGRVSLWPPGPSIVRCVRFTPDGARLLAGFADRTARMWRAADGRPLLVVDAGHSPAGVAWSEKHQSLVTAEGGVKLWSCRFDALDASSPREAAP